jgi:hypothetical protein
MTDPDLPPDLAALEQRLADRPRVEPHADLAARVLTATQDALRQPAPPARSDWHTWAAVAAALLLAVNLSMSVAANTDWDFAPEPPATTAEQLRALAPDLPEAELRRQALLARAAAGLSPTVYLSPNRIEKEPDRWDAP